MQLQVQTSLVVTTPEVSAVRDADRIIGLLESMEKAPISLIINRIKPDMVKRGDMLAVQDVLDILAVDLIGTIPDDESVVTSSNKGEPTFSNGSAEASQAFLNIAKRICAMKFLLWISPEIRRDFSPPFAGFLESRWQLLCLNSCRGFSR